MDQRFIVCSAVCAVALSVGTGCSSPPEGLARPNGLCLSGAGTLYVSDFHHQRVVALDAAGTPRQSIGYQGLERDALWQVWDINCVDEDGVDAVYVTNQRIVAPDSNDQIWEVKRIVDGTVADVFSLKNADGAVPDWLARLARAPDGSWFGADEEANAIVQYDERFVYSGHWTRPIDGPPFESPSDVVVRDGSLWVIEQYRHRVRRLDLEGRQLAMFGTEGRGPGELRFPIALDVCPGKWVAVADYGNYRIQRFTLDGTPLDAFEPPGAVVGEPAQLMDVVVAPDCSRLYVADSKGNRVLVTQPDGTAIQVLSGK